MSNVQATYYSVGSKTITNIFLSEKLGGLFEVAYATDSIAHFIRSIIKTEKYFSYRTNERTHEISRKFRLTNDKRFHFVTPKYFSCFLFCSTDYIIVFFINQFWTPNNRRILAFNYPFQFICSKKISSRTTTKIFSENFSTSKNSSFHILPIVFDLAF